MKDSSFPHDCRRRCFSPHKEFKHKMSQSKLQTAEPFDSKQSKNLTCIPGYRSKTDPKREFCWGAMKGLCAEFTAVLSVVLLLG